MLPILILPLISVTTSVTGKEYMSTDIWVCEYSQTQNCFHIDTLDRTIAINRQGVACGQAADYILLHVARSSEEALAFAKQWEAEHGS